MNKYIEWKDSYSIGVETIDHQHQYLMDLINKLYNTVELSTSKVNINDVLESLINYAQFHFKDEEKRMLLCDYPMYKEHHQEHINFLEKVSTYCIKTSYSREDFTVQIYDFLKDWLIDHILNTDMKLKGCIR